MTVFLKRSIFGILFGSFLMLLTVFMTIYFGHKEVLEATVFVKNALGLMICGWFFSVTPLFFEMENLSLKVQTILHFLCVVVLYFVVAFIIGWIPFTMKGFISMLAIFTLIYAIIWLTTYFYLKKQATKLNEDINNL